MKKTKAAEKELGRKPKRVAQALESSRNARRTVSGGSKIPSDSQKNPNIPEELSTVWDDDIAQAFKSIRPQQQDFLIAYLNTGNSAEAYRRAYNPLAKEHLASVAGSRLLASVGISLILDKFANNKTEALFLVTQGYRDMAKATKPNWVKDENGQYENAGDDPDWQARKEAYLGMRKVHGLDQPTEIKGSMDITSRVIQVELPTKIHG
jgi:hypothetical protein